MEQGATQDRADIIIPVYNKFAHTRNLLEGIYLHTDVPFHIYLVDNASTDETSDLEKIYSRDITVVKNRSSRNRCAAINQGIEMGDNPYVVLMSNDVEVSHGWLGNMVAFLQSHPRIGAVGPLTSSSGHRQSVDQIRSNRVSQIPYFLTNDLHEQNRILQFHFNRAGILIEGQLAFFCIALMRRTINAVGSLDETLPDGFEDDYCRRLRKAGYVLGLLLDTCISCQGSMKQNAMGARNKRELRKAIPAHPKEKPRESA